MKINKLSAILTCSLAIYSCSSFATEHDFVANTSAGYDLPTNELQTLNGHLIKTRTLTCQVRTESVNSSNLSMLAMKKRVVINGIILPEGNATSLMVQPGDNIVLEIDARGKLGLTNNSESLVNLRCH